MPDTPRLHLTHQPLTHIRTTPQSPVPARKPRGLWYALGYQWQALVDQGRIPEKRPGGQIYEITLCPKSRLCVLQTPEDILSFTQAYGRALPWAHPGAPQTKCVDWQAVAQEYQGIEVLSLSRDGRQYLDWLDIDWAVTGGCIWDDQAVQRVSCESP